MLAPIIARINALSDAINHHNAQEVARLNRHPELQFPVLEPSDWEQVTMAPEWQELLDLLKDLSPAHFFMLATLVYLGRGDFDPDADLLDLYLEVSDRFGLGREAVLHLASKVTNWFLAEALRLLAERGIDVDQVLGNSPGV